MALDLQQRSAQRGHRWDYTHYETENGRVVLQADPIKNGRITGIPALHKQIFSQKLRTALNLLTSFEDC